MGDRDSRLRALRAAMERLLPRTHAVLLATLMRFLHRVAGRAAVNKMSTANLAVVFGPTLMPGPKDDMGAMLRDATPINVVMSALIEYPEYIFASFLGDAEPQEAVDADSRTPTGDAPAESFPTVAAGPSQPVAPDEDGGALLSLPPPAPPSHQVGASGMAVASVSPQETSPQGCLGYARALHSYKARNETELSFQQGQLLTVFEQPDSNWWLGAVGGREGFIAAAYVQWLPATPSAATAPSPEEPPFSLPPPPAPDYDLPTPEHVTSRSTAGPGPALPLPPLG
jgi:hypothetical protein